MQLIPLKTPLIESGQTLFPILQKSLAHFSETLKGQDVLIIASKIVAYSQGRLIDIKNKAAFRELVKKEADKVLDEGDMILTLKNRVLIPNAGIDNSNTPNEKVILWPEKPFEFARQFRRELMEAYKLKELGVLISDSHCQPLRQGTSGIALGWAGFEGVQDERGAEDLFGRPMQYTKIAVADNLASAATLEMGETDASIPFVIARHLPLRFSDQPFSEFDIAVPPQECLYRPLYGEKFN